METLPTGDENDIKWINDCFGDLSGPMYISINAKKEVKLESGQDANNYFLPQSTGWFAEFIDATNKSKVYLDYKNASKSFSDFVEPIQSNNGTNGITFEDDMITLTKLSGERTATRMRWIKYAQDEFLRKDEKERDNSSVVDLSKKMRALSKTQFDFSFISSSVAKNIFTGVFPSNVTDNDFKSWLAIRRNRIISQHHRLENKIGMLMTKSETHATILINTQ